MADDIAILESSEQDASPRELIDLSYGTTTLYLTSATRDISDSGKIYVATACTRGVLGQVGAGKSDDLEITLPIDHAFTQRFLQQGLPPVKVSAKLRRRYSASLLERVWEGPITSMRITDDRSSAIFSCEAKLAAALLRVIPQVTAGKTCSHTLYDATCGILKTGSDAGGTPYKHTATVTMVSGRDVTFDLSTVPANHNFRPDYLVEGEIVHVASGEYRTIKAQADLNFGISTVTKITMQERIPGMKVGDTIEIYAGCQWDTLQCDLKFGNLAKMAAYPYMPTSNPYLPGMLVDGG